MILRYSVLCVLVTMVTCSTQCEGDMVWMADAPICITTCPQRFYYQECPDRTIGRCVCPDSKPVRRRDNDSVCVQGNSCEDPDWFKLGASGISAFKFSREPQNQIVTVGRSVTLSCVVTARKPVQYFWYKMDKLPSGDMTSTDNLYIAGTTTINFANIKVTDAGFYQCKAKSQEGYSLLSSVSEIKVKHTSFDTTVKSSDGVVINKARAILACNKASASFPGAEILWRKDGATISAPDTFMNSKKGEEEYGYLYILNVKQDHEGTYKCIATVNDPDVGGTFVLSEITFKIRGSQNQVSGAPTVLKEASYGDVVTMGGTGTLYCGAYGYPAPEYAWAKASSISTPTSISGCGEKICVNDYGRRLTITNIASQDFGGYFCQVKNSVSHNSQVLTLEEKPSSYKINFLGSTPSHMIYPNRYYSFNLTCAVDILSSDKVYIGWYKDGESVSISDRISTEDMLTTESRIRKLVFKYPTENDPGLYQCLAYNTEEFVQSSTDITLHRYEADSNEAESGLWSPDSPFELKLYKEKKGIQEAYQSCIDWRPGAFLVSIMDYAQNDRVFRLLLENNVTKAWIGITDEAKEGKWIWFTEEDSTRYSNWQYDEPNNEGKYGSDYAVMDVAKAGKWEDMSNRDTAFPYACKYYTATCPLIAKDGDFNDYSVNTYLKKSGADIHVFDQALVSCKTGMTSTLVCGTDGKWVFPGIEECEAQGVMGGAVPQYHFNVALLIAVVSLWLVYR